MSGYRFSMRDHFEAAKAICGIDGWEAYQWTVADGGAIVKGCTPSGIYTRGKRKGEPKFRPAVPGTERTVVVGDAHMDQIAAEYEAREGKCWDCKGTGKTWAGWSRDEGSRYRTCSRCCGHKTARAPNTEPQP